MTIAILCADRAGPYPHLANVDVYDADRDARSFTGAKLRAGTPGRRPTVPKLERRLTPAHMARYLVELAASTREVA